MCYNCGCHRVDDDMGNSDNITQKTFLDLSRHLRKTPQETKKYVWDILNGIQNETEHITNMFLKASKAWGQSVKEARKKTQELLSKEFV